MADHFTGIIRIGGQVTAEQWKRMAELEELLVFIDPETKQKTEGAPPLYDGEVYMSEGAIAVDDPQAGGGMFFNLENYLVEQGIPFDRFSSADYGYDAMEASFRVGMEKPLECISTTDGDVTVLVSTVLKVFGDGKAMDDLSEEDLDDLGYGWRLAMLRQEQPLPEFEYYPLGDEVASPYLRG